MLEIIDKLYEKFGGDKVFLIRMGMFFVAFDEDAYILEIVLKLKKTKFTKDINKVGFPISSLNKYIELLEKNNISFIVIDYAEEQNILAEYFLLGAKKFEIKYKYTAQRSLDYSLDIDFLNEEKIEILYKIKKLKYVYLTNLEKMRKIFDGE